MSWTHIEIARLKELHQKGIGTAEISKELNKTRNSIISKLHRIGLKAKSQKVYKPAEDVRYHHHQKYTGAPTTSEYTTEDDNSHKNRTNAALQLYPLNPGTQLLDMKCGCCHFPYGNAAPYEWCGRALQPGSSYCELHHQLTHLKTLRRKEIELPKENTIPNN